MQKMKITVGGESFDEIRKNNWYYVDKTELIYKLVNDTSNKVTLFTRPRRFGKTLNMSMIESFFDITRDSKGIFDGLAISEHTEFCREWMNQYPVLFISLKDVDGLTFESAYSRLSYIIYHLCVKLRPVISKSVVEDSDLSIFNRFLAQTATESDIQNALFVLMRIMYTIYNKPVVLLIDEYDVPLAKANDNGYYRQMLDVIRGIMSISIKTNEYLKFAVITGCLRIAKESIFTGANNFMSYSVLDERFSEYFGFTQS